MDRKWSMRDRKWVFHEQEVEPRMYRSKSQRDRKGVSHTEDVGPGWTGIVSENRQEVGP